MKKKLLFVLSSFDIGGTTISTRNLISVLNADRYDITLWVLRPEGVLQWMYDGQKTISTCFIAQALFLNSWRDEKNLIRRLCAAAVRFFAKRLELLYKLLCGYAIRKCCGKHLYDTVVACEEGGLSKFVSNFNCPNLIAWVRCDYKQYFSSHGNQIELFYNKYNHIVCVSEITKDNFISIYPQYAKKTSCIYNPQDSGLIISQSDIDDRDTRFKTDKTTIVSLGRLSAVKRFEEIPHVARLLADKGLDFRWYIIGCGEKERVISNQILINDVSERVIMLGAKSNPHYYIKRADLYVCLSSTEACPRVINEAKILGTPVVSTDFSTVYEYLEDGLNGCIAPLERIADTVYSLLTDNNLYSKIKQEIAGFSFDNAGLIKKLETIL